jgi:hypothetical protein
LCWSCSCPWLSPSVATGPRRVPRSQHLPMSRRLLLQSLPRRPYRRGVAKISRLSAPEPDEGLIQLCVSEDYSSLRLTNVSMKVLWVWSEGGVESYEVYPAEPSTVEGEAAHTAVPGVCGGQGCVVSPDDVLVAWGTPPLELRFQIDFSRTLSANVASALASAAVRRLTSARSRSAGQIANCAINFSQFAQQEPDYSLDTFRQGFVTAESCGTTLFRNDPQAETAAAKAYRSTRTAFGGSFADEATRIVSRIHILRP